ncbi:MAG: ATP-binding cassette domain-containing protein [Eubacterium sp.]
MLELKHIVKDYIAGDTTVNALKGIDIKFRKNEFVSILGPSGCGKTTMLNIIGGLDKYTSGDLIINGKSTKEFKDRDWDAYRNNSVGFVFQNYNLIPHQSVLSNVELALTLSGVSKAERKRRASEALAKVGLSDQMHKKPNQMSGGQMQRVAIARALVNNPDILLADEPTGALDTATSVQIMEILKEVAKDKLVIMVTHNPDLAEKYSTRIIRLLDGQKTDDTNPYDGQESEDAEYSPKRTSMSMLTALSLSFNNLLTKKARTFLTAFAGSIGIIGIALILSLSTGINDYIKSVEEDTLSAYPLTIQSESADLTSLFQAFAGNGMNEEHGLDKIYSQNLMGKVIDAMVSETKTNNLKAFKEYIDNSEEFAKASSAVTYSYDTSLSIYLNKDDDVIQVNPFDMSAYGMSSESSADKESGNYSNMMMSSSGSPSIMSGNTWVEMIDNQELLDSQYEVISGHWPENYNECVLVVSENNEVYDLTLYALGLKESSELFDLMMDAKAGIHDDEDVDIDTQMDSYSYDDIMGLSYKLVLPTDCYEKNEQDNTWRYMGNDEEYMEDVIKNALDINLVGIVRVKEEATSTTISAGSIAYTSALTEYYINAINDSEIVKQQKNDETVDVFNGLRFSTGDEKELTDKQKAKKVKEYFQGLANVEKASTYLEIASVPTDEQKQEIISQYTASCTDRTSKQELIRQMLAGMDESAQEQMDMDADSLIEYLEALDDNEFDEAFNQIMDTIAEESYAAQVSAQLGTLTNDQAATMLDEYIENLDLESLAVLYDKYIPTEYSESTFEDNCTILGVQSLDTPTGINIYAESFDSKEEIEKLIAEYNNDVSQEDEIQYTDYVALVMSSITNMVDIVSYVLIAFVSISLIVSSIMIGIITYISVLERTKEIGILRSIGASKKDVSRVFNAETIIVGLVAGVIGILITVLLCIPINIIIESLVDVSNIAKLPWKGAIILIVISILLTMIAGLIPSKVAAKKDPVEALRSE